MPMIRFTSAENSETEGGSNCYHHVEAVLAHQNVVMVESSSDEDDGDDDDNGGGSGGGGSGGDDAHFHGDQSSASRSSSSSSSSSSLFGRLFPFLRAMEEARRVVFHPIRPPPRVDEFDWKVEFRPATCAGSKRSSDEASAPSEPMIWTPRCRSRHHRNSSSDGGGPYFSPFSSTVGAVTAAARSVTVEKPPAAFENSRTTRPDRDVRNNSVGNQEYGEYTRPAKRSKVEGRGSHNGSLSGVPGILRSSDHRSSSVATTDACTGSLDRTSASARQQESSKTKSKSLRFVESRMRVVRRLQVGSLINFGGSGRRNRNGGVAFGEEEDDDDQDEGGENAVGEFSISDDWEHEESARASQTSRIRLVQRLGFGTVAEF